MLPISRIGVDVAIGVCNIGVPHPIVCLPITGSFITDAEGLPVVRLGDTTQNSCIPYNPVGVVISGSALTDTEGLPIARLGDFIQHANGVAVLITGSAIVDSL